MAFPWLAATIALTLIFKNAFAYSDPENRNLYSAGLVLLILGLAFYFSTVPLLWLVLTTNITGYIAFKVVIKKEYTEMEKFFGEEYRKYRAITPEFFPFPVKKWFR